MITVIKNKITNLMVESTTEMGFRTGLQDIVDEIKRYEDENEAETDIHAVFRTLERYSTQYKAEVKKYMALPEDVKSRIYQAQEILCILSLILSLLHSVTKRYNTSSDKGSLAKYLRMIGEEKELYKSEKISWLSTQKTLQALQQSINNHNQLRILELQGAVDKEEL